MGLESFAFSQKMKKEYGWSCLGGVYGPAPEVTYILLPLFYWLELSYSYLQGRSYLIAKEAGKCGLVHAGRQGNAFDED